MSVQISGYRNIYTTLNLYIKNTVLREWIETETNEALTYDSTTQLWLPDYTESEPSPVSTGRGWVYFDYPNLLIEQSSQIVVRDISSSVLVQNADYKVNYGLGGIVQLGSSVPFEVDYTYNYVAVVDEWRQLNRSQLPVVVVDIETLGKEGFQLGGAGYKYVNRSHLYIFATSRAERDDLTDILHSALFNRQLTPQDFSNGTPLDFDGTFNTGYVITTLSGALTCATYFDNVVSRKLQFNVVNDVNEFRSRIDFDMITFTY